VSAPRPRAAPGREATDGEETSLKRSRPQRPGRSRHETETSACRGEWRRGAHSPRSEQRPIVCRRKERVANAHPPNLARNRHGYFRQHTSGPIGPCTAIGGSECCATQPVPAKFWGWAFATRSSRRHTIGRARFRGLVCSRRHSPRHADVRSHGGPSWPLPAGSLSESLPRFGRSLPGAARRLGADTPAIFHFASAPLPRDGSGFCRTLARVTVLPLTSQLLLLCSR